MRAALDPGSIENEQFLAAKIAVLPPDTTLLSPALAGEPSAVLFKEIDTCTAGMIRCFHVGTNSAVVVEEMDLHTKETIWRPMSSVEEAHAFVSDREDTYEAMWGGA
jgi:hypothetical protein